MQIFYLATRQSTTDRLYCRLTAELSLLVLLGLIIATDLRSHENNLAHRTREIDRERLIVRRGQPFSVALQYSDSLPPQHHLQLVLHLGEYSQTWKLLGCGVNNS